MKPERRAAYRVTLSPTILRTLPPTFLSLTLDTSVLIGGHWWGDSRGTHQGLSRDRVAPLDLDDPRLARWTRALAPCLLRVGGTEADRIVYGFRHDGEAPEPADPEAFVLKGALWRRLNEWAAAQGLGLVFTVSAGPEARLPDGNWDARGAERLMRNTVRKGYPVVAWEFGNEVNAYPLLYGLRRGLSSRQYLRDFAVFANLVRQVAPGTRTIGPASAIWPYVGEVHPMIPALGRSPVAALLDVLSFHYYPQQSDRGRVAVRRAKETTVLSRRALDGALRWVRHARRSLARGPGKKAALWLTEVGHALYGGQSGVSDTWLSTPWWLDQLGLYAHAGVDAVFRQSLVGGDYGLLSPDFVPRPDYFASVLHKRLLGPSVHERPVVAGPDHRVRAWHQSHSDGRWTVLLVNLHRRRTASVDLGPGEHTVWTLEPSEGFASTRASLGGVELVGTDGLKRAQNDPGVARQGPVELAPLACAFVEIAALTKN